MGGAEISVAALLGRNVQKRDAEKFQTTTIGIANKDANKTVFAGGLVPETTVPVREIKNSLVKARLSTNPTALVATNFGY